MSHRLRPVCLRAVTVTKMLFPSQFLKHGKVLSKSQVQTFLCVSWAGISNTYLPLTLNSVRTHSSSTEDIEDDSSDVMKHLEAENMNNIRRQLSPTDEMINVGRLVPHRLLDLVDDTEETLRNVTSSTAVKMAQKKDLKLVLVNQHAKPLPLYKLMTGAELHQEQLKKNEKKKSKAGQTIVKDVKLTATIGVNDINVKRRHINDWLSKDGNIQIRVTVMQKGRHPQSKEEMVAIIHKVMDGLDEPLVFNNEPKATGKNGQNVGVVLRRMSAKEKAKYIKEQNLLEKMKSTIPSSSDV